MATHLYNAYAKTKSLGLSGAALEAEAFFRAARLLETDKMSTVFRGLRFTHSLWTIVQAEMLDPSNQLPHHLKTDLLSLSLFVDREIRTALTNPASQRLKVLSDINRNLAVGLTVPH